MPDGNIPNDELLRLLRNNAKLSKTSFQPRPLKGRRSRQGPVQGNRPEQPRAIRGKVFANVAAGDASFVITHIVPLASGTDPRSDTTDDTELIEVANNLKEAFYGNEYVTAIYSPAVIPATDDDPAVDWEVIVVERYRSIRGTWHSGTGTLVIDHIVPLESGLDPRTDTTSDAETINVLNVPGDTYSTGNNKVYADYNASSGLWESRPKAGIGSAGASGSYVCSLSGSVSAGSTGSMTVASSVTIYQPAQGGGLSSVSGKVYNPFSMSITPYSGELFACAKYYQHNPDSETAADDEYMLIGQEPRQRLASLSGFGAEKILDVPAGSGGAASDIRWEGAECS